MRAPRALLLFCICVVALAGCSSAPDRRLRPLVTRGEYARAAARIESTMTDKRADRNFLLDRMSLGILRLADGYPQAAEAPLLEVFDTLRTQGINDDKTVAAAVFGEEGVIFWKGEPFEQALAFTYIAIQRAQNDQWDNSRAAAGSSLFLLKDFGENERGGRKSTRDIAEEAVRREQADRDSDYLDKGYTPVPTNFALGHLMAGIANIALAEGSPDREAEARDHFREAFTIEHALRPIADALVARQANAVFIVDYGLGPRKTRYGPDGALARFAPVTSSDSRPLHVYLNDKPPAAFPIACDVNLMAADHMWNNFEDVRQARSAIGQAMILGGVVTTASSGGDTGGWIGLGLILGGLLTRAGAQADIRHCETLPQRTYIATLWLPPGESTVSFEVPDDSGARLTLPGITPPDPLQPLKMFYVRLPAQDIPQDWAISGTPHYAGDEAGRGVDGDELPYILGGRCVRRPSARALKRYHEAGYLTDLTSADLEDLYRREGIDISDRAPRGHEGMHLLEGGRWLGAPRPGSTGFARVFCRQHAPYQPRSQIVADLARELEAQRSARSP